MTDLFRLRTMLGALALAAIASLLTAPGATAEPLAPARWSRWTRVDHGAPRPWIPTWRRGERWGHVTPAVVLPDPGPAHAAELDAAIARLGHLIREREGAAGTSSPARP